MACAPGIPAKGRRDVRGNAVSQTALHVVAAGPCPLFCPVPFTCLSPCPRTVVSGRGSDAPCGEGSQKGDGEYRREQKAGPRKTSKPRLPKLKR
ncbi:hypothetical protein GJ339_21555 [Escherichia coli]|nr:hypothetical protein [Escherichia coli]EFH7811524.1 hypothetical protein [Escherichia coli]MWD95102.1 hypothetical protein [Escherichia coli]